MRFYTQSRKPHFLILGDDEKLTFLLKAFEKDSQKPTSSKFQHRMNIAVPKSFLAAKELNTSYHFRPGVTTFDVGSQSMVNLVGKGAQDIILVGLLTKDQEVMTLVEKLNRHYQQHPKSLVKTFIHY